MKRSIGDSRRAQGIFNKNLSVPTPGVRTRAAWQPAARSAQVLTGKTEVPFASGGEFDAPDVLHLNISVEDIGEVSGGKIGANYTNMPEIPS
ncbi:MAG TPA: hypothetical protein VII35_06795, partial [Steroidobacteraceae bacterium]